MVGMMSCTLLAVGNVLVVCNVETVAFLVLYEILSALQTGAKKMVWIWRV